MNDSNEKNKLKKTWSSPALTRIGTLSEVVQSGVGKGATSNEGNAGGGSAEFRPGT